MSGGESFEINRKLGRADGVGHVGLLWAQVLAWGGHPQEALAVLDAAAEAFTTLQQPGNVAQVRTLQEQIKASAPDFAAG